MTSRAGGLLLGEWLKLRTLQATVLTLLSAVLAMLVTGLGISAYVAARWSALGLEERAAFDPVTTPLAGFVLAQVAVGIAGAVLVTSEYATGMVRTTLCAVPRRLPVVWTKALVVAAVVAVAMLATGLLCALGAQVLLPSSSAVPLSAPGAARTVLSTTAYLSLVGVLGVAVGFLVRATAGAVGALVGVLLVLPTVAVALPSAAVQRLVPYLPSEAGRSLMATVPVDGRLGGGQGLVVLLLWVAAALLAAAALLRRRDA